MKRIILILGFIGLTGLLIYSELYVERKYYDPKHRLENARTEITKLTDKGEIRDGDLIFQTSLSGQSKAIQLATKERYGDEIPMNEIVISPSAIFDSELLTTVKSN